MRQAWGMGDGNWYDDDIERVVVTEEQIRDKTEELAALVAADYTHVDSLLLVGVLKGAVMFMADFARALGRASRRGRDGVHGDLLVRATCHILRRGPHPQGS